MLKLELPLPPSKNALTVAARRWAKKPDGSSHSYQGRRDSDAYAAYKEEVWALVMAQTTIDERDTLVGKQLAIHVMFRFPPGSKMEKDGDAANVIDGLLDALAPALGVNDKAFWQGQWTRHPYHELPECVVRVWEAKAVDSTE